PAARPLLLGAANSIADPLISPEQLVAAKAGEQDRDPMLAREPSHRVVAIRGDIPDRIVHGPYEPGEKLNKILLVQLHIEERDTEMTGITRGGESLVGVGSSGVSDAEGLERSRIAARSQRRNDGRVDATTERDSNGHIGSSHDPACLFELGANETDDVAAGA